MVKKEVNNLTILTGRGNWWWAGSLQQGYNWIKENNIPKDDFVLIINDDTVFQPDFLVKAVSLLENHDKTLLLACYYSQQDGRLIDSGVHVNWKNLSHGQADTKDKINCLSTRGLFMRVSDFIGIGGFYPKLIPQYLSDYEFTIRAWRRGFNLLTDATLKLWGNENTTGINNISDENTWIAVKKMFSIRSALNPIVWSIYIILACPLRWIFINTCRIWLRACIQLFPCVSRDIGKLIKG
jgi:GT2 family glycosyltransferase